MATLRQTISKVIKSAKSTTLVTVNAKCEPRCRLMANLAKGVSKTLYLATYLASNKVREIKTNPRVSLVYTSGERSYACVSGRAKIKTDQKTKSRLWKKEWIHYFPGGKTDPNYVIIEVTAKRIDFCDMANPGIETLKL